MRVRSLGSAAALFAAATLAIAAEAPPTAAGLLALAESQAAAEYKSVFLIFHASW
ncbi:MAG: hypothetical protein ACLQU1_00800 [Bryobacteraceae bacterium]